MMCRNPFSFYSWAKVRFKNDTRKLLLDFLSFYQPLLQSLWFSSILFFANQGKIFSQRYKNLVKVMDDIVRLFITFYLRIMALMTNHKCWTMVVNTP